jgi:hypothetical protein
MLKAALPILALLFLVPPSTAEWQLHTAGDCVTVACKYCEYDSRDLLRCDLTACVAGTLLEVKVWDPEPESRPDFLAVERWSC